MSTTSVENKHKCSCGRTFRHAISLKRHQKVSGCAGAEVELELNSEIEPAPLAPVNSVENTENEAIDSPNNSKTNFKPITVEQIALWQKQKNLDLSSNQAPSQQSFWQKIDWSGLHSLSIEFAAFTYDQARSAGNFLSYLAQLGTRCTLFGAFLLGLGWLCLLGISTDLTSTPASATEQVKLSEMSARSTVTSFLQTAGLGQYERARGYLADQVKASVSASDISKIANSLDLASAPQDVSSSLGNNGKSAKVTIVRGDTTEIYTLLEGERGWGLSSVATRRS